MIQKPLLSFGRRPSPSEQPAHIGPQPRARVVEGEEGVKPKLLEFALPGNAPASAFEGDVGGMGQASDHVFGVVRVLVGEEGRTSGIKRVFFNEADRCSLAG